MAVGHGTGLCHPMRASKLLTRLECDGLVLGARDGRGRVWCLGTG